MIPMKSFLAALKFVVHVAAVRDIRYYLNSVQFEFAPSGDLTLIATDGHRMAVAVLRDSGLSGVDFLANTESVKRALDVLKKSTGDATFSFAGGSLAVRDDSGMAVPFAVVDGKFPDWRRVVPKPPTVPTATGSFNAVYLAEAYKAIAPLTPGFPKSPVALEENYGENSCKVIRTPLSSLPNLSDAYVIVMPSRAWVSQS